MRALVVIAAAFALIAPGASAQTPAQLLVGEWHCSAPTGDLVSAGAIVYLADGNSTFDQTVSGKVETVDLVVRVIGSATWSIGADGKLTDRIVTAQGVSGTINGQPMPEQFLVTMADEVKAAGLSVSEFTVNATKLLISDGNGGGSDCTRKAPAS